MTESRTGERTWKGIAAVFGCAMAMTGAFAAESPVVVKGKNIEWTCCETPTGCVVDFTNKVGILKRKGKPDVPDPRMLVHAEVLYKPNGKTYTFDIAPAGTLSVALGGDMPDFPKRFADTNVYAAVDIAAPFDIGTTADRPSQRIISNRCHGKFMIKTVPCEMYSRGWVLCAVSDDPKKEKAFTVRITRWMDDNEYNYTGRSKYAMATRLVDFDGAKKEQVGEVILDGRKTPLWLVEFPVDMGDIQDIVYTDDRGNFIGEIGRYLDFEVCGPLLTRVSALNDTTMDTDPERVSAVTFYGARLERSAAELVTAWTEPGNIFADDDKPETRASVKVHRPGEYELAWTIGDVAGKVLKTGSRRFSADGDMTLDLAQRELGWYSLDWRLSDAGGRVLATHKAAFALLGPDTRTSRKGEGPYGCLGPGIAHMFMKEKDYKYALEIKSKAGYRKHGFLPDRWNKMYDEYKLGPGMFCYVDREFGAVLDGKTTEEQVVAKLKQRERDFPFCRNCQLFWESSPKAYAQATEVTGGTYDPANAMPGASNRVELALKTAAMFRRHYPDMPITLGNTIACTELIAELMRAGYPESYGGYMGLEVVGRDNLPERQWNASIQAADYFRELAGRFGYAWKPNQGVETNYRRDTFLGEDRQAQFYVRDLLLCQMWRFTLCFAGGFIEASNQYVESLWGNSAMNKRWPYAYPKKSYVAVATLTRMLDMVQDGVVSHRTGDDCVYAVSFPRRDGRVVTVFWTSYGTAELEVEASGAFERVGFYGNALVPEKGPRFALAAGVEPQYLVGGPDTVKSVRVVKTNPADTPVPADYRALLKTDDASAFAVADHDVEDIETGLGAGTPCRVRAKHASVRTVDDPEMGRCVELDLGEPDLSLPKPVMESMTVFLKKPLAIPGKPQSIGFVAKGNSGWGRIYWILEGADGKRTISTTLRAWKSNDWDCIGKMSFGFTGWRFSSYPVGEHTSVVDYSVNTVEDLWTTGVVKYPAKLVGFAFAAESRPLFLTERRRKEQKMRISEIGFFDLKAEIGR